MKCFDYPELEEIISGKFSGRSRLAVKCHLFFCRKCRSNYKMLKHDAEFVSVFKTGIDYMQKNQFSAAPENEK